MATLQASFMASPPTADRDAALIRQLGAGREKLTCSFGVLYAKCLMKPLSIGLPGR